MFFRQIVALFGFLAFLLAFQLFQEQTISNFLPKYDTETVQMSRSTMLRPNNNNDNENNDNNNDNESLTTTTKLLATAMTKSRQELQTKDQICAHGKGPAQREPGSIGVLYAAGGTRQFIIQALIPVVRFLTNLGMPNAVDRKASNVEYPQYALATEPHLCDSLPMEVIDFFDVITVTTELEDGRVNPTKEQDKEIDLNSDAYKRLTRDPGDGKRSFFGQGNKHERYNKELRHWVKAIKLHAIVNGPFEITLFMDIDTLPCRTSFASQIMNVYPQIDFGIQPLKYGGYNISKRLESHYRNPKMTDEDMRHESGYDLHNSALLILNMTSPSTNELVQRWQSNFYSLEQGTEESMWDQPSLGLTMYQMYQENNQRDFHTDINDRVLCRKQLTGIRAACNREDEGQSCIVGHKLKSTFAPSKALMQQDESSSTDRRL